MAANFDKRSEYTVHGRVVDRSSQVGLRGMRVEAWDRDTKYHDLLGQAVTSESGHFVIGFDSAYFGDFAPDRAPDLFFKVFRGARELLSTFDRPLMDARPGRTEVKLELDMPQAEARGTDRISAQQTLKAIDWWRASDFRGAYREGVDKLGTVGKLVGKLSGGSMTRFEFEPIRPKGAREKEIVNQDVNHAQRALVLQQVEVAEVRPLAPGTRAALRTLRDYPLQLKAGDRVTLYEQDGVVKYYTRVASIDAKAVDGEVVARLDGDLQSLKSKLRVMESVRAEVDGLKAADVAVQDQVGKGDGDLRAQADEITRLQRELADVRKAASAKDAELVKLRTDLSAVRKAQDNLATRVSADRFDALEAQIRRLSGSVEPEKKAAAAKAATGTAAKTAASAKKAGAAAKKPATRKSSGAGKGKKA